MKVVAIEAGPRLKVSDYPFDEITAGLRNEYGRYKSNWEVPTTRPNSRVAATRPLGATGPMINAVGGTSIHWMTQSWRFLPWNFKIPSESRKRYGPNAIPKDSTSIDWPFDYNELEPYYDKHRVLRRRVRPGRERSGDDRSPRQHLRGGAAPSVSASRRCVPPGGRS